MIFGLDETAWNLWLKYRKEIRKPLRPMSQSLASKKLASFGPDQMAIVEQSIENGWQGLFPLANKPQVMKQSEADILWPRVYEAIREGRWPQDIPPESKARRVVANMGGLQSLGMRPANKTEFMRREFVQSFSQTV